MEKYLTFLLYNKWLSINTIVRYRKWLKKFEWFLLPAWKSIDKPTEIQLYDVFSFVCEMWKNWLSASSINNTINAIRWYLRYCKSIDNLDVIDASKITSCKIPERNIWFFNDSQKSLIKKAVDNWIWKGEITKLRNKILTYMLMNTWLRCHEIAKIKVSEIWESLQVIGKWWKRRVVYLKKELLKDIYEYLSRRKRESEYLFDSTKKWQHLYEWSIRKIYMDLSKEVWFHVHAHKFRHTFATDLLHIPWSNIYNVAKLLGHKRITTTQLYLWCGDEELKNLQFKLNF